MRQVARSHPYRWSEDVRRRMGALAHATIRLRTAHIKAFTPPVTVWTKGKPDAPATGVFKLG